MLLWQSYHSYVNYQLIFNTIYQQGRGTPFSDNYYENNNRLVAYLITSLFSCHYTDL